MAAAAAAAAAAEESSAAVVLEVANLVAESMKEKLQVLDKESRNRPQPTIYKVPHDVRLDDKGAYEPKVISIGPYHHGKDGLHPLESIKWTYLHDLLDRSGDNKLENYAKAVAARETEVRARYSEAIEFSSQAFVEMLVLDGCFILELFIRRRLRKIQGRLAAERRNSPLLRHDLLLLENQIPFFILQTLFDNTVIEFPVSSDGANGMTMGSPTLMDLTVQYLTRGKVETLNLPAAENHVHHLLHLNHLCLSQGLEPEKSETQPSLSGELISLVIICLRYIFKKLRNLICLVFAGILYIIVSFFQLLMLKKPFWFPYKRRSRRSTRIVGTLPSVNELREVGVQFKKKEARCYLDISFEDGEMKMPFLSFDANTNSEFRNLLAFEQCRPDSGNKFTSYVVLMSNIVDSASDVTVLGRSRILGNKLGSDKEVAEAFNKLKGLTFNGATKKDHYLSDLFKKVEEYDELDHHRWSAKLMNDYFSNPWAIISVIVAFVLLVLTALQTVYTILSYR